MKQDIIVLIMILKIGTKLYITQILNMKNINI